MKYVRLSATVILAFSAVSGNAMMIRETPIKSHAHNCTLIRKTFSITDPVSGSEGEVVFDHYSPKARSSATVIIMPPTGGENILDRFYARNFCKRGLGAVLMKTWTSDTESTLEFDSHDNGFKRAIHAVTRTLEFVPGRIGILGTSLGSLYASTLLAIEPRIESGVLIVGGSPLSTILATSSLPTVKRQREERMKNLGIESVAAYEQAIKDKVYLDVSNFLPLRPDKSVFMINALKDTVIPSETQQILWNELGRPRKLEINAGHAGTIFKSYFRYHREIESFLVEKLSK